jgi:hypothetical protein
LKQLMKDCQATFCTPFKICQNWARFIRNVKLCKFIENTLKIDYNGRNFNIVEIPAFEFKPTADKKKKSNVGTVSDR